MLIVAPSLYADTRNLFFTLNLYINGKLASPSLYADTRNLFSTLNLYINGIFLNLQSSERVVFRVSF